MEGRRKRKDRREGRRREGKGKEGLLVAHQVCTDQHSRSAQSSLVQPENKCPGGAQVLDRHEVTCLPASTESHSHVPGNRLWGLHACLPWCSFLRHRGTGAHPCVSLSHTTQSLGRAHLTCSGCTGSSRGQQHPLSSGLAWVNQCDLGCQTA